MPSFTENRLVMLAGMPGCGKSTFARRFFQGFQIVSSDAIREELWPGQEYDHDRNSQVFDEFYKRLGTLISTGHTAVADATFLTPVSRDDARKVAGLYGVPIDAIFFNNPVQARRQNAGRTGSAHVPPEAMDYMYEKHLATRDAILLEMFNSLTVIAEVR